MKKKNKKGLDIELTAINVFLCVLLISLVIIILYYFILYKNIAGNRSKLWNVYFSRIVNKDCSYEAVCTTPTIYSNSTTTGDYTVEFNGPNQKAVYEIMVKNDGLVDAEVTNIVLGTPHCKGTSNNIENASEDANKVCEKLNYTLLDSDNNKVVPGTIIKSGESTTYQLVLSYDNNNYCVAEEERISDSVIVRNLNLTIDYNQVR